MPIVSGVIAYDSTNLYSYPNAVPAARITGVPVALQNTSTGVGLVLLTDSTGAFVFNNVPAGTYNLVEAWGASGAVTSPGNFASATVISAPTPLDPPISKAPSPPATATRLQSLTRNTIPVTVTTVDVTSQNFVDAPIIETPIILRESSIIGLNLITDAQNGQWGTLPNGASNQQIAATAPYLGIVPSEVYYPAPGNVGGIGSAYNVTNICYYASYNTQWYSMANHTTFDETSRMMVINAAGGGPSTNERIFQVTIPNVSPNTYYIGFAWIANLFNWNAGVTPQLGVKVSNTSGTVIFNSPTPQLVFSNPPQWVQIGGVFNTGNNSNVVVAYQSIAIGANGNDYVADDFSLYQLVINNFVNSSKTVDKSIAKVGDILTYTIVLKNTGSITAETIQFQDTVPVGTSFVSGSVYVNGTNQGTFNPGTGFNIGGISSGATATIIFKVNVVSIPQGGVAINNSTSIYNFAPVSGGVTIPQSVYSNSTQTDIVTATIIKSVSNNYIGVNNTLIYTVVYNNQSSITASNVIFSDTIPSGSTFVNSSMSANGVPISGNPNPPGVLLPDVPPNSTLTITFNVNVNNSIAGSPLKNTGTIQSKFTNGLGESVTVPANSNTTTTTIVAAILSSTKQVNKAYANIGDILTYTIPISNNGNTTASSIVFIDTIPSGTTYVTGSLKQDGAAVSGIPNSPGITLPNSIKASGVSTVVFQVQIVTIPSPNPIPNSSSSTSSYTIDSTTTPNLIGSSSSNSNTVTTQVNNANLGNIYKTVDKAYAECGDIITYTILIPNTGNITAQNVVFKDTVPNGTVFVANSMTINGAAQSGANPQVGISIPNISPGGNITITFKVQVQC